MTTPKDNALHLMEGQGDWRLVPVEPTQAMLDAAERTEQIHNEYGVDLYVENTEDVYRAMIAAAPVCPVKEKTSFAHWVDEVEASGEAEPTRDDNELAADFDHRLRDWNRKRAPHFAIPPSNDVATLQRELNDAYEGLARERGITKELAEALPPILEAYTRMLHFKAFTGEEIEAMPRVANARAALSKVQHFAARGAEVSE